MVNQKLIKLTISLALTASLSFLVGCESPAGTDVSYESAELERPTASEDSYSYGNNKSADFDPQTSPSTSPSFVPTPQASPSATASSKPSEQGSSASIQAPLSPEIESSQNIVKEETKLTEQEFFQNYGVNPFVDVKKDNLSTFGIDVDTASYTLMRSSINNGGYLPSKNSVRTEEYLNFFDYNYIKPEGKDFSINLEGSPSKFGEANTKLIRFGIQGKEIKIEDRKSASLTFVIDVSGSMNLGNRLGLVKQALEILVSQLKANDQVAIVVYGSSAKVILDHTSINNEETILRAIRGLNSEGSTNAEDGLKTAYDLANKNFLSGGINRVILCSDGVANIGRTGPDEILEIIKQKSDGGITLSTIGFGMGNYNDVLMEQLANKGDGNYAYVDNIKEAQRVFVENLTGTLQVIAKDTKIQVEFNPEIVTEYRLLGYENRDIADKDFRNDSVDAGEVGSNHNVTALYEVKLKENNNTGKIAELFLRYKNVDNQNSIVETNQSIFVEDLKNDFNETSDSFKLSTSVAEFAEILKQSYWAKDSSFEKVLEISKNINLENETDKIKEFNQLVQKAIEIRLNQQ